MKIAILTAGRFHVCDLARELDAQGHEVAFYSCVPRWRTRQFGLPDHCNRSLFYPLAPLFVLMQKSQEKPWQDITDQLLVAALDARAARVLEPCDVFIGMSGMSSKTARTAREKYGAQIWIERGSRHILSQKEILDGIAGAGLDVRRVPAYAVKRELADYALADTLVVPSLHVEQSFLERGFPREKLFRNPYGVDLTMFPPTPKPEHQTPVVLTAGRWSHRKGCDLLWAACETNGWRLHHVGPLGDAPLPRSPLFEHHDAVPQWQLAEQFARADVFALASREEGLSLVQAQALACGLPLVCTDRTGGEDLREMLDDPEWITVVPHDDAAELGRGLARALSLAAKQSGARNILSSGRERLSWRGYGERYAREIEARYAAHAQPSLKESPR